MASTRARRGETTADLLRAPQYAVQFRRAFLLLLLVAGGGRGTGAACGGREGIARDLAHENADHVGGLA